MARRIVAATRRAHAQPVAPEWRVGSAYRARPRLATTASAAVKSPPSSVTPPTTSASLAETSNEAENTSDVTDETPINAACGPSSTSSPAPKVQRATSGKMAMPRMPNNAPRKAPMATSTPVPATILARKRCPGWNTAMSVKKEPTAAQPPARG